MEADLAEVLEPAVAALPGRCADWLAATLTAAGQTACTAALAEAQRSHESAKAALDAAYAAAFVR